MVLVYIVDHDNRIVAIDGPWCGSICKPASHRRTIRHGPPDCWDEFLAARSTKFGCASYEI